MEELVAITTYVPSDRVIEFQKQAAQWVAAAGHESMLQDGETGRYNDRWEADKRPDWTDDDLDFARFLHKKLWSGSVSGRALSYMADHPDAPIKGGELAVELGVATDAKHEKSFRKIAGCWGHVGRYCEEHRRALPFQWNEEDGYWITEKTAAVLKNAGF